jgi:hypothetical protein
MSQTCRRQRTDSKEGNIGISYRDIARTIFENVHDFGVLCLPIGLEMVILT